ncbi:MAG: ribonuclease III [Nitriliruptoraceae bacterium]
MTEVADSTRSAAQLAAELAVPMEDVSLLDQALCHRSWTFEHPGGDDNERLEFLGDAVLGLVVTDRIYSANPDEREGRLAKVRAAAVKTASLAAIARELRLGDYVRLGRGEANSGGGDKDSILADTFEAVLGSVYLTCGFEVVFELIERLLGPRLAELADVDAALDYKTSLQELAAAQFGEVPRYTLTDDGPDHDKTFRATVMVDGRAVGEGTGPSKKAAEQDAARQAYRALRVSA